LRRPQNDRAEVKLAPDIIKELVTKHYGLPIQTVDKVRAIYKITTPRGSFGFKNAEELPDLPFVTHCLHQIRQNGFERTPRVLLTNQGKYLLDHLGQTYFMEEWFDFAEVPKESFSYLSNIAATLADFHYSAKGIIPSSASHRFEWGKRREHLLTALYKIKGWKQRPARNVMEKSILDFLDYRCSLALDYIRHVSPNELISVCPEAAVLCHGGLHHKNILVDPHSTIWFIDFETMVYAERVMDLAQLLQYHAAPYNWNPMVVNTFLSAYISRLARPICAQEWNIFMSYLAFPRRFYNRMMRYFEHNEHPQEFLTKLVETMDQDLAKEKYFRIPLANNYVTSPST
jgi:CotS family spore coat protein